MFSIFTRSPISSFAKSRAAKSKETVTKFEAREYVKVSLPVETKSSVLDEHFGKVKAYSPFGSALPKSIVLSAGMFANILS